MGVLAPFDITPPYRQSKVTAVESKHNNKDIHFISLIS